MNTLRRFSAVPFDIPGGTSWYLADLGEYRGKQELYTRQMPQRLKSLRENALIESAISSNRMEGVEIAPKRVRQVLVKPRPLFHDRDEEEVRGYREALGLIHDGYADLAISEETICRLHRLARGEIWDAGKYKEQESDIIERLPSGEQRLRFRTVPAADVTPHTAALIADWNRCLADRWVHPLIGMACFNLDFLCIHPFRDGNGRVSRLLLLLQSYHLGFEVGRYISLERLIEQNKERYYETLAHSSQGWHEGKHDPWHYVNFVLFILKSAYRELVERVGEVKAPRGTKTEMVLAAIARLPPEFTVAQLEQACSGVSREMIRRVLGSERGKSVECIGRGPGARWTRLATSKKGNVP